jgi:DNA (cytosine-5)-methyltransferase 1
MPPNKSRKITVGDLFSGIGGFSLGLERTGGFETKWFVESDPFCNKVLAKHWPNVKRYGDIRDVGKHNLEPVDLICGGFPCQDISFAGKGAGLAGARSGLWYEFARVISEMRPRYVLVENVSAILYRGLGEVLSTLASLRYDAEWHCIPAAYVSAPHHRDRLWLIAYTKGNDGGKRNLLEEGKERQAPTQLRGLYSVVRGAYKRGWNKEPSSRFLRVDDGLPFQVDRLKSLGNAVVPAIVQILGEAIIQCENLAHTQEQG